MSVTMVLPRPDLIWIWTDRGWLFFRLLLNEGRISEELIEKLGNCDLLASMCLVALVLSLF